MSRWARAGLLAMLLAGMALTYGPASAQQPGVIEGIVANGTTGAFVADAPVTLQVVRNGRPMERLETVADGEGRFRFDSLEVSPSIRHIPSTEYAGVNYASDPVDLTQTTDPVHIVAYETTNFDDDISILRASIAVSSVDETTGLIQVLEVVTFVNGGDRAFVGGVLTDPVVGGVLQLQLPVSSLDLNIGSGFSSEGPLAAPDGLLTRAPVPPGDLRLSFWYKLPFASDTYTIEKLFAYPVQRVSFLISTSGPRPSSDQLTSVTTVDVNGMPNFSLSAERIASGEPVQIILAGLPSLSPPQTGGDGVHLDTALRGAGIAGMAALLAGLSLYTVTRRRQRADPVGESLLELHALEEERLALVTSLAELDDASEADRLPKEDYGPARQVRQERLVDIMLLIKERLQSEER